MRLIDLVSNELANSPALADPIWLKQAEHVTAFQLTLFRARMSGHGLARQGDEAVGVLQSRALQVAIERNLKLPFLNHPVAHPRFMADELVDGLSKLESVEAQAVLLALEERQSLEWVTSLTWEDVLRKSPRTALSATIVRRRNSTRHMRLTYVFWRFLGEGIAGPLLGLEAKSRRAFKMGWEDLSMAYTFLVMIDRKGDAADFDRLLGSR